MPFDISDNVGWVFSFQFSKAILHCLYLVGSTLAIVYIFSLHNVQPSNVVLGFTVQSYRSLKLSIHGLVLSFKLALMTILSVHCFVQGGTNLFLKRKRYRFY